MSYAPNFQTAVDFTLAQEGVLSNHAADPGGLTKYGIIDANWKKYSKGKKDLPVSVKDITAEQAVEWYHSEVWLATKISALPRELQVPVFDFVVNSGADDAIPMLQKLIGVKPDGEIGPVTLKKLEPMQPPTLRRLRNDYVTERLVWLMDLAQRKPALVAFIEGWARRVSKLYDFQY